MVWGLFFEAVFCSQILFLMLILLVHYLQKMWCACHESRWPLKFSLLVYLLFNILAGLACLSVCMTMWVTDSLYDQRVMGSILLCSTVFKSLFYLGNIPSMRLNLSLGLVLPPGPHVTFTAQELNILGSMQVYLRDRNQINSFLVVRYFPEVSTFHWPIEKD